jgi:hypothetical protein
MPPPIPGAPPMPGFPGPPMPGAPPLPAQFSGGGAFGPPGGMPPPRPMLPGGPAFAMPPPPGSMGAPRPLGAPPGVVWCDHIAGVYMPVWLIPVPGSPRRCTPWAPPSRDDGPASTYAAPAAAAAFQWPPSGPCRCPPEVQRGSTSTHGGSWSGSGRPPWASSWLPGTVWGTDAVRRSTGAWHAVFVAWHMTWGTWGAGCGGRHVEWCGRCEA